MGLARTGRRQGEATHELIAPDVFPVEVGHPLSKYERRGMLTDADVLWADVMTTCPVLLPYVPLTPHAMQLAKQARIAVYDCLYVALAEREGCGVADGGRQVAAEPAGQPDRAAGVVAVIR